MPFKCFVGVVVSVAAVVELVSSLVLYGIVIVAVVAGFRFQKSGAGDPCTKEMEGFEKGVNGLRAKRKTKRGLGKHVVDLYEKNIEKPGDECERLMC